VYYGEVPVSNVWYLCGRDQKDTGLDNWGRGADPWMSDREKKQREQARISKKFENDIRQGKSRGK